MTEFRRIEIKKIIRVEIKEYPKDIKNLNPRLKKVIKNYFKKGERISFIDGFNFQYKKAETNMREIWIYSWAEHNGEQLPPIIVKEKCKKKK